jgi:hypothetical protein
MSNQQAQGNSMVSDLIPNPIPKGLQWTAEKANKAYENNTYIYVRSAQEIADGEASSLQNNSKGSKGVKKTVPRKLVTAPKYWASNEQYVVVPSHRICGDYGQVALALYYARASPSSVEQPFSSLQATADWLQNNSGMLTAANYKENPYFVGESVKNINESKVKSSARYSLDDIVLFSESLKEARRPNEVPNNDGTMSPKTKRNKSVSLADKVNKARSEGKILDISKMKENGADSRSKPPLKANSKSLLRNVSNTDISDLFSNKLEPFIYAIRLLYGDDGLVKYASSIEELRQKLNTTKMVPLIGNPSMPLPMAKTPVFSAR